MSWAFTGALLAGAGAYYATRVATLGTGGSTVPLTGGTAWFYRRNFYETHG